MAVTPEKLRMDQVPGDPLRTIRPRYLFDQTQGKRGRRARMKIISPTPKGPKSIGVSESVRKDLVNKGFTSFLITDMSFGMSEKVQINETFGDSLTVMAFGAAPIVLNISGVVFDDIDNDWFVRLIYAYKDYIRATKLAKNFELVRLDMPGSSFIGTVLNLNVQQNSQNDAFIPFNMQFLVRSFQFYSTMTSDDQALNEERGLEQIGQDGSMTQQSLNALKKAKTSLEKLNLGSSVLDGFTKSYPSLEPLNGAVRGIVNIGNSISNSEAVQYLEGVAEKFEGVANKVDFLKKSLGEYKKVKDKSPQTGRTYRLRVIGTYSEALEYAGEEDALTEFLGNTKRSLDFISGALERITKSKAGKFLLKGKNLAKAKGLISDVKNAAKMVGVIKGMANPFGQNGIIQQGVAVLDSLKEVGQAFVGKIGAAAASPTNAVDKALKSEKLLNSVLFNSRDAAELKAKPKELDLEGALTLPLEYIPQSIPKSGNSALVHTG